MSITHVRKSTRRNLTNVAFLDQQVNAGVLIKINLNRIWYYVIKIYVGFMDRALIVNVSVVYCTGYPRLVSPGFPGNLLLLFFLLFFQILILN